MNDMEFLLNETSPALHNVIRRVAKVSLDTNVEKNREMLLQRSNFGIAKYGCTTESILTLRDCLQHALEEALDMANYLQAAITKIDNKGI